MLTFSSSNPSYQVGGSLPFDAPTYVRRQADEVLFQGLRQGDFCYIFNARQMGKSSLRVQTTHRLQAEGIRCGVIDITTIGTQEISAEQWYASIIGLLVKTFKLNVNLLSWWRDREPLSFINRLSDFLDTVLLEQVPEPIIIFIDEIDSVQSLSFSTDDFFALIRACYNRRAEQSKYRRLTFALFGVATPADLISDATRTPFNIGKAIELRGFQFLEATPLISGLTTTIAKPDTALERILYWTGGQPFLTQKLCKLVADRAWEMGRVWQGRRNEGDREILTAIDRLVEARLVNNWEAQDEPEHLTTIRDRLLYSEQRVGRLLGLYQKILLHSCLDSDSEGIPINNSPEQTELILTGLVEKRDGNLQVKNPIYQQVFNLDWVGQQLAILRPYSQAIKAWAISGCQDESWLLRGKALQNVLAWSQGKSLSDVDYQFLAASQELERQETQKKLESERLKEVEARLKLERQHSLAQQHHLKRQRVLLSVVSAMMMVAIALGLFAYRQYQQTALSEMKAIVLSSQALFASHKWLDSLIQAIKAKERLQKLQNVDSNWQSEVDSTLWQAVLSVQEANRLNGHTAAVMAVDFSPDGTEIATASVDGTIKLWRRNGALQKTLTGHQAIVRAVKFSPDGDILASAGDDKTIKLWRRDGTLLKTLRAQTSGLWSIDFSPDGKTLISGGSDSTVEEWNREGQLLTTFQGEKTGIRTVAFSPDGQTIAAGTINNTIDLWNRDGTLRTRLQGHPTPIYAIAFSPDSQMLASGTVDGIVQLWNANGTLLRTLSAHTATVKDLKFSPDGQQLASGSWDKTLKLWKRDGTLRATLKGHDATIWGIAFSPDGREIASAGAENVVILWKSQSIFQKTLYDLTDLSRGLEFNADGSVIITSGTSKTINLWQLDGTPIRAIEAHEAVVGAIAIDPDDNVLASVSEDKTLKLWQLDGTLLQAFPKYSAALLSVSWHPSDRILAVGSADGKVLLWQQQGRLLKTLAGHTAPVWSVAFSPDGQTLASGSNDTHIHLWTATGDPVKVLRGHSAAIWKVVFSPDSQILASGSGDTTVKLWKRDGTLLKTLTGHTAAVWGIAFSPDGSLIATTSIDETVKLWTREGVLLNTLKGHDSGVRTVAFHPHLPILASFSDDQTIILWNVDRILNTEPLTYACRWVQDYLQTNLKVEPENSQLCRNSNQEWRH